MLALLPLYVMALIGFVARKTAILDEQSNQVITRLMLYLTLPALILFTLDTDFSSELMMEFAWLSAMSAFVLTVSVLAAAWLRKRAMLPESQKSVYESLILFGNQGFIGFAVSFILLGPQGVLYLTLFNIFYLILIWTYGIYLFTKHDPEINWRVLLVNPGILATLTGLVTLFLPIGWPVVLQGAFEHVGRMTIPLSMILIGSLLAETRLTDFKRYTRNIYLWIAAFFKLLILPLVLFIFYFFQVSQPVMTIAVLTAAMPSATTTSVYAKRYGADAVFASYGIILSTIGCIITIPLIYVLLEWLYG